MKHLVWLISLLICMVSCTSDEPKQENEQNWFETEAIARIDNADGTYYTLHDTFIRLRKSDGSVVANYDIQFPEPLIESLPYGETQRFPLYPEDFYISNQNIVVLFAPNDINSVNPIKEGFIKLFVLDKKLTHCEEKEIAFGKYFHIIENDELCIISRDLVLNIYSRTGEFKQKINSPTNIESNVVRNMTSKTHVAFGKVNNEYLLFSCYDMYGERNKGDLINYSAALYSEIMLPNLSRVVHDFFPNESSRYPRFKSEEYYFDNEHLINKKFLVSYEGSELSCTYKYDSLGHQVEPLPENEYVDIWFTGARNMFFPNDDPKTSGMPYDYLCYVNNKGDIQIEAHWHYYEFHKNVDISFECTNNEVIEFFPQSTPNEEGLYSGYAKFSFTPIKPGEFDIIITAPDYNKTETIHCCVVDYWSL